LPNVGNTCFANALIQCLYSTNQFKDIIQSMFEKGYKHKLLQPLAEIFYWLDGKGKYGNHKHISTQLSLFISEISKVAPNIRLYSFGDPNILFNAIFSQLPSDLNTLYIGNIQKRYICSQCASDDGYLNPKRIYFTDDALSTFDVNRNFYNEKDMSSLFQKTTDIIPCKYCKAETKHMVCTYFTDEPPQILVINLEDDDMQNDSCESPSAILETIVLKHKTKNAYVTYDFFAAVATSKRGSCAIHSVGVVADEFNPGKGLAYLFNDDQDVKQVKLSKLGYFPRLVFYHIVNL